VSLASCIDAKGPGKYPARERTRHWLVTADGRQVPGTAPGRARLGGPTGRPALEPEVGDLHGLASHADDLQHTAFFYHKDVEYESIVQDFVRDGIERAEPAFVALPENRLGLDRQLPPGAIVTFADMRRLGRNPARVIPALQAFADQHPGQRVRYLGESLWVGRSAAEQLAAARFEALVNLAFAGAEMTMLCLYNAADLATQVVARACSTHPTLVIDGRERQSQRYRGPDGYPDGLDGPLPSPPAHASCLAYDRDLRPLRTLVGAAAQQAGLNPSRCTDLVIAASEVAANTLRHTGAGGVLRVWQTDAEVLCQVEDPGHIRDPLAGYRRPADATTGGQGLWLVNQVCDLVEIRTGALGTTIRLHMQRG
jgi:anti-sigma regulatory factor (Ser/Thr protein kinase)